MPVPARWFDVGTSFVGVHAPHCDWSSSSMRSLNSDANALRITFGGPDRIGSRTAVPGM